MTPEEILEKATKARNNGKISEAINLYQEYISLVENNDYPEKEYRIGEAYHMIGVCYKIGVKSYGDVYFENALDAYAKAAEMFRGHSDLYNYGRVLRDKATMYATSGHAADSLEIFEESYNYQNDRVDEHIAEAGITLGKWGMALFRLGRNDEALEKMHQAMEMTHDRWPFYEASIYLDLGRVYKDLGQYDESLEAADFSLEYFSRADIKSEHIRRLSEVYLLLSQVYKARNDEGDIIRSSHYNDLYTELSSTLDPQVRVLIESQVIQKEGTK